MDTGSQPQAIALSRFNKASSLGTPVNSILPLIAMAGVAMMRYLTATSGCWVTSTSTQWISGISVFAFSIMLATNSLAVWHLAQPGAESSSILITVKAPLRSCGEMLYPG